MVAIPSGKSTKLTTAKAYILKGLDTVATYSLLPKMNVINFEGQPNTTYTLVVGKDSYSRFSYDFQLKDLRGHAPFKVTLEPALTAVAIPLLQDNYFAMQLDAWGYFDYRVDWGDGTSEIWPSGLTTILEHEYPKAGNYFVSITSHALDSVLTVGNLYGAGDIDRLGMEHLINLHEFRMEGTAGPDAIDLSNSTFLSEVRLYNAVVKDLILPENNPIYLVELIGCSRLTHQSFDEVASVLLRQVTNAPRTGELLYYMPVDGVTPILQPSAETLAKLQVLKDTYHWYIVPSPDTPLQSVIQRKSR
jgi:hypothetical protein